MQLKEKPSWNFTTCLDKENKAANNVFQEQVN